MICRTCIRRASALSRRADTVFRRTPQQPLFRQTFSTTIVTRQAAAAAPANATASENEPSARSSCPPGTVLNGLNYFKGRTDPVALPDNEYPEWLWSCMDVMKRAASEEDVGGGDEFSKSRKQRRIAAKKQRALEAQLLATGNIELLAPKIPLQEQSINMPGSTDGTVEDAVMSANKRDELRKAMRKTRKAKIKEDNYLKSM